MEKEFNVREDSFSATDREYEKKLRPVEFAEFSGQQKIVKNLKENILVPKVSYKIQK